MDLMLKTTTEQFRNKINKAIKKKMDFKLSHLVGPSVKVQVRELLKNAIISSPSWQSIQSGKLRYHFGIPNPETKLSQILSIWINSIDVIVSPARVIQDKAIGKLKLIAIKSDYNDVLNIEAAKQMTEKHESLAWLSWILLMGDKRIIKEFHIVVGPTKHSRTGEAVMSKGGLWGVPSEFAGTKDNNMITRAIDSIHDNILEIFRKELRK